MTTAISEWVTSLGDFPLDPMSGKAWLWADQGERLLWVSQGARNDLGMQTDARGLRVEPAALRSFAPLLQLAAPDQEPVRVQQVTLTLGVRSESYTCLCRHVPLVTGAYGLLAVAIGAPARSLSVMRTGGITRLPRKLSEAPAEESLGRVAGLSRTAAVADPETETAPVSIAQPSHPLPDWLDLDADLRRPLRFVWQTDEAGRFVHLSRELAQAVGIANAMILGKTWPEITRLLGLLEADGIAEGFQAFDTWSAPPALWPVEGSKLGVPVEMAGMPVREAGRSTGFRGYGIARVERAVMRPSSAAAALAGDAIASTEKPEERFGPAALRALSEAQTVTLPDNLVLGARQRDLRAVADVKPTELPEAPATPAMPVTADNSTVSPLSSVEREAFREIAKALAALTPGIKTLDNPTTGNSLPKASGREPQHPLDILRQDLIERGGLQFQDTGAKPTENTDKPVSPVVSYDALQARREQRSRPDPLLNAATAMIERAPVGLLVMRDGEAVFANRYLLDLTGFADFRTFKIEGGTESLFRRRKNGRDSEMRHFAITGQNDETIQVEATIHAITWDEAPATLTSFRKVAAGKTVNAQQKAAELDLLAAQAELRELHSVLDTATDGVIILDSSGRILSLNRSAEALFGFDQKEIIGESLVILLEPESHVAALDYLDGLQSNGVNSILNDGRDVKGRERNGGVIPLFMTIGRVGGRKGTVKFCAVLRDITHWKKVEADLIDAKRAAEDSSANKTDFLARISHEIRTPLNAIIGFSQVMMSESFGPIGNERYRQYIKDINASGEHVVSLVNDLLDLSKVASGKLELTFSSVDINSLVAACVAMIQPQANAGRVIIRSQLSANVPPVVGDDRSIRQIMINLLSNAAKFTDPGGQVVASTSLTDQGEVVIRVRDTGIGMAKDDIKKAMEPFRQIPGPRSSGGTGLGLPLTKALVDANRAVFAIESEPHKGTLVEVTFPSTRVLAE